MDYKDDQEVLQNLRAIKKDAKKELKSYLLQTQGVEIDENSVFDIQIKRLHEYKRQQMNALYAIYKYKEIKKGNLPKRPLTMIFGAKAAPAYTIAKDIIHLILCLQELVEKDPQVNKHLKIVMVENYNVTKAEKLIPACDISEQISLASKEASGTGNMKFMLNGAVTLELRMAPMWRFISWWEMTISTFLVRNQRRSLNCTILPVIVLRISMTAIR